MACAETNLPTKLHLDPSSRLATIHQRYRQTDRQAGQDRTDRQRSDRIGELFLQTVAQNLLKSYYFSAAFNICWLLLALVLLTVAMHLRSSCNRRTLSLLTIMMMTDLLLIQYTALIIISCRPISGMTISDLGYSLVLSMATRDLYYFRNPKWIRVFRTHVRRVALLLIQLDPVLMSRRRLRYISYTRTSCC